MAIQELYNKLRIKREYGRGDVVIRLSYDEVDTLLMGLVELGADVNEGYDHLVEFKKSLETQPQELVDTIPAYDGLRAKANTGKYKDAVGFIHIVKNDKKPIKLVFPSGKEQVYSLTQIDVIEKDREKLDKRMLDIMISYVKEKNMEVEGKWEKTSI